MTATAGRVRRGARLRAARRDRGPHACAGRFAAMLCATALIGACGPDAAEEAPTPSAGLGLTGALGADVWIADLHWESSGPPAIGEPRNLTARSGYDNQPYFTPDGRGLWYTAVDEHDGQADIWRYDFDAERVSRITQSNPESEYSATPLPDGSGISVVRVEADSTQRLWRFDPDGANARVLLEGVAPVGYHAWADARTVVMFVLGEPPTLERADTETGAVERIASDIGRSIQRIPGGGDLSFVQRAADGSTTIMRLPQGGGEPVPIVEAVDGGDFHAWAPNGTLLMASGPVVYAHVPSAGGAWTAVADFSSLRLSVTRLAVSPDGAQIALVGEVTF